MQQRIVRTHYLVRDHARESEIDLQRDAEILAVCGHGGNIALSVLELNDEARDKRPRKFAVYEAHRPFPVYPQKRYIGTASADAKLFHVFEVVEADVTGGWPSMT